MNGQQLGDWRRGQHLQHHGAQQGHQLQVWPLAGFLLAFCWLFAGSLLVLCWLALGEITEQDVDFKWHLAANIWLACGWVAAELLWFARVCLDLLGFASPSI